MGIADDLQGLAARLVEPLRGYFVAWDSRSSGARVYNSAAISIPNAALTTLTFDTERYDIGGFHSTTTNTSRLTAATAGTYLIIGNIRFASNATGERRVNIFYNGSDIIAYVLSAPVSGNVTILNVSTCYYLNAGDYVEMQAYQNSGGAINVDSISAYSPEFMIARI